MRLLGKSAIGNLGPRTKDLCRTYRSPPYQIMRANQSNDAVWTRVANFQYSPDRGVFGAIGFDTTALGSYALVYAEARVLVSTSNTRETVYVGSSSNYEPVNTLFYTGEVGLLDVFPDLQLTSKPQPKAAGDPTSTTTDTTSLRRDFFHKAPEFLLLSLIAPTLSNALNSEPIITSATIQVTGGLNPLEDRLSLHPEILYQMISNGTISIDPASGVDPSNFPNSSSLTITQIKDFVTSVLNPTVIDIGDEILRGNITAGSLTIEGSGGNKIAPSRIEEILRNVVYLNSDVNPTEGSKEITILIAEEFVTFSGGATTVNVVADGETRAPILVTSPTDQITEVYENDTFYLDPGFSIGDVGDGKIFSATIRIHPVFHDDRLLISNTTVGLQNTTTLRRLDCANTTAAICDDPDVLLPSGDCRSCAIVVNIQGAASLDDYEKAFQALQFHIPDRGRVMKEHLKTVELSVANEHTTSTVGTFQVSVRPRNRPPKENPTQKLVRTLEGTPVEGEMLASDPNGDLLVFYIQCKPDKGAVQILNPNLGTFRYTPNSNEVGEDSFTFQASDGEFSTEMVAIFIEIEPVNDKPQAFDISLDVWEGQTVTGNLAAFDVDGPDDVVEFLIISEPTESSSLVLSQSSVESGDISIFRRGVNPFNFTLTSKSPLIRSDRLTKPFFLTKGASYDSFMYAAVDKHNTLSNVATVNLKIQTVRRENTAPVAFDMNFISEEDRTVLGFMNATDAESPGTLTFILVEPALKGTVSILDARGGSFQYVPLPNYQGTDSFVYVVKDAMEATSNRATISFTVVAENDAPAALCELEGLISTEAKSRLCNKTATSLVSSSNNFQRSTAPSLARSQNTVELVQRLEEVVSDTSTNPSIKTYFQVQRHNRLAARNKTALEPETSTRNEVLAEVGDVEGSSGAASRISNDQLISGQSAETNVALAVFNDVTVEVLMGGKKHIALVGIDVEDYDRDLAFQVYEIPNRGAYYQYCPDTQFVTRISHVPFILEANITCRLPWLLVDFEGTRDRGEPIGAIHWRTFDAEVTLWFTLEATIQHCVHHAHRGQGLQWIHTTRINAQRALQAPLRMPLDRSSALCAPKTLFKAATTVKAVMSALPTCSVEEGQSNKPSVSARSAPGTLWKLENASCAIEGYWINPSDSGDIRQCYPREACPGLVSEQDVLSGFYIIATNA
ncbi:hypothetical protein BSKO_14005 [Bryopsis sp. KO-2023]|nr:hypothetical protein BSKO_14005 [Bryopsis sp. KO-2023]